MTERFNPKTDSPCPDCGGPKDRRAKRCSPCARTADRGRLAEMGRTGPKPTANPAVAVLAKARATAVRTPEGCLHPTAWTVRSDGYVRVRADGKWMLLHRLVAQESAGRELVDSETVDHTCHNGSGCEAGRDCPHRRCIEPAHLEVMPDKVSNWARGTLGAVGRRRRKTHCPAGHPYAGKNLQVRASDGARVCRACHRAKVAGRDRATEPYEL